MTLWEMCGNGARIIGMKIMKVRRVMGVSGKGVMRVTECCVAVRASTTRPSSVPLSVSGSTATTATTLSVSVWSRGILNLFSFFPFFPFFSSFLLFVAVRRTAWPASGPEIFLVFSTILLWLSHLEFAELIA